VHPSTMSSAVGPEPTSKADPTAVGSVPELCDCKMRAAPSPLTRFARGSWSWPAFLSAFAVWGEMVADVELVDPPAVFVELLPPWPVDFPPLPDGWHSL